ncbi:MAG: hybrid sensor histidine kinase/response regulator [Thiovulaceae bacterium]|nr:hybrid sensor histidine kinase/response regulator [Sulfurimonadaceae bacterium]
MEFNNSDFTILVVDDVEVNVFYITTLLSKVGYKTLTATNGQEALEITMEQEPDLILLDIMMPVMGGMEVARVLKSMPEKQFIPIIFLSALSSSEDIVEGFEAGGADYISKPFKKDELLTRIKHQISLIAAARIIFKQNEELQKTIIGRDKLYSVIAHDLRSPIASVKMVMDLLINNIPKESLKPDIYELLMMANNLTEDSFNLLDNLLKWTKSQTGTLNTVFQNNVDLMNLIYGVIESINGVSKLKNISINLIGKTSCEARIDIDMIKSVLRNLLNNAIKFSYEGTSIDVILTENEDRLIIDIKDHGVGISKDKQIKLFNIESHYSSHGTDHENGSGLGLLLCKEFVKRNGGSLWFESQEEVGSTFSFDIPIQK